jgi:hypothetical protein
VIEISKYKLGKRGEGEVFYAAIPRNGYFTKELPVSIVN